MSGNGHNAVQSGGGSVRRPGAIRFRLFLLTAVVVVGVLGWLGVRLEQATSAAYGNATLAAWATQLAVNPTSSSTMTVTSPPVTTTPAPTLPSAFGTLVYAARLNGRSHLWAIVPGSTSPVRLTAGEWDDRDPAFSPDGTRLAFSSRRDGTWDLYLLDLASGVTTRLTATSGYEAHPTWSPDGMWLAYEACYDTDLDIWVLPVDGGQEPIQLTNQDGLDVSPAWDPNGRTIAFISDRDGSPDVFLADLDDPGNRFRNLTQSPDIAEAAPAYGPDGSRLAYAAVDGGVEELRLLDLDQANPDPITVGQGSAPVWLADGSVIAGLARSAQRSLLVLYGLQRDPLYMEGLAPIGDVEGLTWSSAGLPGEALTAADGLPVSEPLYVPSTESIAESGRLSLVTLPGYSPARFQLSDAVDEAFDALRDQVARQVGWDFLASLENAFVGLNDPLPPGFAFTDWLYTGRAFAFDLAIYQAGWVEIAREDFAGQTYWRVFVRASIQDGSLGEPLRVRPWTFDLRFSGDPVAYDRGGAFKPTIPAGFYVDFTRLAADYGFERLPAMVNWRTYFPAARFNEFAHPDALDWTEAMYQLYPPEAVVTPTRFRTPTITPTSTVRPTPTPWWWRWRTPTASRTPTPFVTSTGTP